MKREPRWSWSIAAVLAACVAFVLLAVRTGRCMSETVEGVAREAGLGPFAEHGAYIWAVIAVLLFIPNAIVRAFRR